MRVLWITNILFPDVCKKIGIKPPDMCGWLYSGAQCLLNTNSEIILAVASLYDGEHLKEISLNGISYYLVPNSGQNIKYNFNLEEYWLDIQNQFRPDIVHIHGTEYPHGLAYVHACGNNNVVVSIQGLVSVCERYYLGNIEWVYLLVNITLRDLLRMDTIFSQHNKMKKRGELERGLIQSVNHIIGRTSWDKSHIWAINPQAIYHFCNETLRNEFYQHIWNINNCEKHSIFISQAHYPLKGLQQIIKALPIILSHFPNAIIYVAGNDFVTNRGWRLNGFGKYIQKLMEKNKVTRNVVFTGVLSENEMCCRYLTSHVFVSASSIENSSNSISEAQLLGVPCVASYVGGISNLVTDGETGLLYRFEEVEMLAAAVCQIFSNDNFAMKLSRQSKKIATTRHDKLVNSKNLSNIYKTIYDSKS